VGPYAGAVLAGSEACRGPATMKPAENPALHASAQFGSLNQGYGRWRGTLAAIAVSLLALVFCYWDAVVSMVQTWERNGTYAHGFIVFPVSAWLIWRERAQLAALPVGIFAPGIVALGLASLIWLVGDLATIQTLREFAFVVSVPLVIWTFVGTRVAKTIAVPLFLMMFAWPAGEFLIPRLVDGTAEFTVTALRLVGVPVFQQGNSFIIPTGSWSVVDVCSGIRYLIASVFGGTVFAYLTFRSTTRRLVMIGVSVIVPIIANWVRAFLIVLTGHLSENRIATGIDHLIYGWVFFGLVITLVFYVGSRFSDMQDVQPSRFDHLKPQGSKRATSPKWLGLTIVAVVLAASSGPIVAFGLDRQANGRSGEVVLSVPTGAGGWQQVETSFTKWIPPFKKPTASLTRQYARDQEPLGLYVGYYRNQRAGAKLLTFASTTLGDYGASWRALDREIVRVPSQAGGYDVIEKLMHSDDQVLLVWEWYWIGGARHVDVLPAKLAQVRNVLAGSGDDSAAVLVYTPYTDDRIAARDRLASFVAAFQPALDEALRQASAQ
jgi:exosortase A